jgi:radical SAM-linked protein
MKTRLKFTKSGPLKFIGHLDVMRYFQKAIRRAELDVEYSQGYSPHQLMSFAAPLGVGLTSDGEYLDVQFHTCDAPEIMVEKLNAVMAEDIQIVDFKILPDTSKNAMSIVAAADYLVSIKDGYSFLEKELFEIKFKEFYLQNSINITKKTKKSENEVDIKPFIYSYGFLQKDFFDSIGQSGAMNQDFSSVAETYKNGIRVFMQLATGSVNNLKPELVMEAFCQYAGIEYNTFAYQIHRMEVYAACGNDSDQTLVPLNQVL